MKNAIIVILSLLVIGLGSYIIFDKVTGKNVNSNNNIKETENEEYSIDNFVGIYSWSKKYTNEYGNELNLNITLKLNSDGTAEYKAGSGYAYESTIGTYKLVDNEKIVYTREYYNYDNQEKTVYDDLNNKVEEFTIIDASTLQNTYYNQKTELKK